ncbi:uncharacterized protein LOC105683089 isoform X5 [Athalia rosae]|nr:uncharacterized protein LOC105683089 isoform X5 [Athalia rosae]
MHTASVTKWPSGSSEPGRGDRGESCSPSPSPLSPSRRRKRLRKTSTGSTSGSGEKSEEINEITLVATNIVKPEPAIVPQEGSEHMRRPLNASNESQGSIDEDQISIMSNMESSSATTPAQSEGSMQDISQQSGANAAQTSAVSQPPAHQAVKQAGSKRGRLLMRQPRVKKESEPGHPSPDSEPGSPHIVASPVSYPTTSSSHPSSTPILNLPQSSQAWEDTQRTPSPHITVVNQQSLMTVNTPTNLLTVPQPSYLVKQHSHPLLPSQQQSVPGSYLIHRQHSNPEYPGRSTSPSIVIDHAPFIKTEESVHGEGRDGRESGSHVTGLRVRTAELRRSSSSPQTGVRGEVRLSREGSSDQRLGHCPVQRPGPALGCNHCWNTIDAHGRILRRKTKYHCPECQTNLCIVPCFQEFHERQREVSTLRPLPKTSSI